MNHPLTVFCAPRLDHAATLDRPKTEQSNFQCDIRASFAAAFRNWRLKSRLPLKQIAKDLGLSVSTVNSWELGQRFPTGANFERLVNYTGVPPCKLFCILADKCVPVECLLAMGRKP